MTELEVEIPLSGLYDMEIAELILDEVEEAIEGQYSPDGYTSVRPMGEERLGKIQQMRRELRKNGCSWSMTVEVSMNEDTSD
jgi:hypothetical protein